MQRLEFQLAPESAAAVQEKLGLNADALEGLAVLQREGQPRLTVFERTETGGDARSGRRVHVLLEAPGGVSPCSWRAFARPHQVVADLQASRAGGRVMATGDAAFDAGVAVVAREGDPVEQTFTGPVRSSLQRMLPGPDAAAGTLPEAEVTAGAQHLSWVARSQLEAPFDAVEKILAGMLTLYAALPRPRR